MSTTNPQIGDEARVMVFWTTRGEMERVFARLWQRRHELARILGCDAEFVLRGAVVMLRSARYWSSEGDLACVERGACYDLATLHHAAEEVFRGDHELIDELGGILDAASSGKWNGRSEDCDDYVFCAEGWRMVRERGEEGDE